jgi:S-adenosylmethionine:tRNA ribosyltransferase-isomerase
MQVSDFDYPLPESLIAQAPATPRDASRLLVLPAEGAAAHRAFTELPELLAPGDLLVFNDTRVIPARLVGVKEATGGKVEMLLTDPVGGELPRRWHAMGQAAKPIREGVRLRFGELTAVVERVEGEGFYQLLLDREGAELEAALASAGRLPLPPYIKRPPTAEDAERYQTVFARRPGSAAAPTAGLHFTPEVLARLEARGVARAAVTLHVGPGTFLPVRGDTLEGTMRGGSEVTLGAGGRALAAHAAGWWRWGPPRSDAESPRGGAVQPGAGRTVLFIRPGHTFGVVDLLVTNFHLPRSTLLMLVCAFGGRERVLAAYQEAVRCEYRFFSYGDAMLLTRGGSSPGRMV